MKKLLVIVCAISFVCLCGMVTPLSATIVTYSNFTSWDSAVGTYLTEDFSDSTLNPGLSITSDGGGSVQYGVWHDIVDSDPVKNTTFSFDTAILALSGIWDLKNPGGAGEGIDVDIELISGGTTVFVASLSNQLSDQFWGFTSTEAFDTLVLSGAGGVGSQETYELDDLRYEPVPEPATMLLLGSGLIGLAGMGRRKFFKK